MPRYIDPFKKADLIWEDLCKELGIDPDVCRKITIEITLNEPIRVFPELLVRKDSKIFESAESDDNAR